MSKVVSLSKARSARRKATGSRSLCREGHHKWEVVTERRFDVKRGRLVTLYRCARCAKERTELI